MAIWRLVLEGKGFKERYPEAKAAELDRRYDDFGF